MAYRVNQLARISGVSVRTLHFYDDIGLLKPSYVGANGYRFYEETQLLKLQQILFYRELGFELKQIQKVLAQPQFNRIDALESHRKVLRNNISRTRKLILTIDKTIEHLKGRKKMKTQDMFAGFSAEQQTKHEEYLINRFGSGIKKGIEQSKAKVKNWTKEDWQKSGMVFDGICNDLVGLMQTKKSSPSLEVQKVVERHLKWLKQFWTPTRESYTGHSQLIVDSDLRKAYEKYHPQLPEFMAAAIREFVASGKM